MKQSDFPENLVWHYTTGHGLLGIITNHVLWASSALFLNDSNELLTGHHVLQREFDEQKPTMDAEEARGLSDLISSLEHSVRLSRFVLSASEDDDSLTMWRLYGNDEVSYAVGLDPNVGLIPRQQARGDHHPNPPTGYYEEHEVHDEEGNLIGAWNPDTIEADDQIWMPVIYADDEQRELAADAINALRIGLLSKGETFMEFLVMSGVMEKLRLLKDQGFKDEREQRVLASANPEWKFLKHRPGRFGLIPYLELGVPVGSVRTNWPEPMLPLPIRCIRVGPSPFVREAKQSLKQLLELNGYGSVRVEVSETPFR